MSSPLPRKQDEDMVGVIADVTGKWYNGKFYECHPTEPKTYLYNGEKYKYYWSDIAGMPLMVKKDISEEAIAAEAKRADGLTYQGKEAMDINPYTTLGWAKFADLAKLDEPSLIFLDDGIRSIRRSIIDNFCPSSGDWIKTNVHPHLVALFHRLDVQYNDGRSDMDCNPGWARYEDSKLSVDARIRGALSSRRARCNENGFWASTAALDTIVEICLWRNIT